jgi:hypothetical protein
VHFHLYHEPKCHKFIYWLSLLLALIGGRQVNTSHDSDLRLSLLTPRVG